MKNTPLNSPEAQKLPLRLDKTLQWLEESRDSWKEKTKATKDSLKKQKLAVKRAREGRESLHYELTKEKESHCRSQEELSQRNAEVAKLKVQLEEANQQIELLKKKTSRH